MSFGRQRGRVGGEFKPHSPTTNSAKALVFCLTFQGGTIASRKRTERVSIARHALVWALYEHHRSFTRVGKFVGGRDHTTMMNSGKAVSLITSSLEYRHLCELVLEMVRSEQLPLQGKNHGVNQKSLMFGLSKRLNKLLLSLLKSHSGECTRTSPDIVAVDVFNSGKRWLVRFDAL